MKLKQVTGVAMTVASWLLAASCALDERALTLAIPELDIGGTLLGLDHAAASGSTKSLRPASMPFAVRRATATTAIDPGRVTAGFAARAGIRVDDMGRAPLPPRADACGESSHADDSLIEKVSAHEVPAAGLPDGAACNQNADCQSNTCRNWSPDNDGDGFGEAGTVFRRCGAPGRGFAGNADDCCDIDVLANPAQTAFQSRTSACGSFDFNCDGVVEVSPPAIACEDLDLASCGTPDEGGVLVSTRPVCGVPGPGSQCFVVDGVCAPVRGVLVTPTCL
jgi:hypothetical protein